ncbi:hypothetical protein [Halorubrum sp. DTA98]|uniref:hypothetical protein n=1 Tax=Halorubrum sp. DTA98 TaxID=3402163 RepID=UPI003AAF46C5
MDSRRQFLCGSGAAIGAAIAGCTSLGLGSDDDQEYSIRAYNYSESARTFRIRIGESEINFFHVEEVEVEAETAGDTIPFDGVPGGLSVSVDERDGWRNWQFAWPVEGGGGAPAARADILFDPESPQAIIVRAN